MSIQLKSVGVRLLVCTALLCGACSSTDVNANSDGGAGVDQGPAIDASTVPSCERQTTAGMLSVDIPTITLGGKITVDGTTPADTYGAVYLKNIATGDSVSLGQLGQATYVSKLVVPGTYDIYYSWNPQDTSATPPLPRNTNARVRAQVALTSSQTLDVNLPTVALSGKITVDGAIPTDAFGTVYLKNTATGDSLILGQLGVASYVNKNIIPGTYDVYYTWNAQDNTATPSLPRNLNARLQAGVVLASAQTFNVNIPTVTLNGKITVDGALATDTFGTVFLKNTATGDSVSLGQLGSPNYVAKQIVPGTYDIYYSWNSTLDTSTMPTIPRNSNVRLQANVDLTSSQTLNVNLPTITLNGKVTVDGAIPVDTFGTVYLKNTTSGDSMILGQLGAPNYVSKQIVPGTYDVYYTWNSQDNSAMITLPRNTNVRLQTGVMLVSSQMLNVNIPTITLNGKITVDGALPTDTYAAVVLKNTATGDSLSLGQLGQPSYVAKQIVPGVYDVYYAWDVNDSSMPISVPRNTNARVQTAVALTSSQTLNVDLHGITLNGKITVNGAVPTDTFGAVYLKNLALGDSAALGATGVPMYVSKQVMPGIYDIYYTWNTADTGAMTMTMIPLPRNSLANLGCIKIVP